MVGEWAPGEQPWGRQHAQEVHCPYCGEKKVIQSYEDVHEDDLRIEFYCDNTGCEVRRFTVLAITYGERVTRADVNALLDIDRDPDAPTELNIREVANWDPRREDEAILRRRRGVHSAVR